MTPRPGAAPAAIATTPAALRATGVATTAAASTPPGDQATSTPTTTDEKWGQIRPSRWGQRKSSFSACGPSWKWTSRSHCSQASFQASSRGSSSVKRCGGSPFAGTHLYSCRRCSGGPYRPSNRTRDPACSGLGHTALALLQLLPWEVIRRANIDDMSDRHRI